jgi:sugar phosphate isomerase/epimerase
MLIGTMNHPGHDVVEEIRWMAGMGLEFIDLTLEPPLASPAIIDVDAVRNALEQYRLPVVGHTAFYLPLASAIEGLRQAALAEFRRCIDIFSRLGASSMNIHLDRFTPFHDRSFFVRRNIESLSELLPEAAQHGIGLMIENLPGDFNNAAQVGEVLDALPELGLHLDFGHANLLVPYNTAREMLDAYGDRLRHVHLHDNKGGHEDLHLPLGAGNLDVPEVVATLKDVGYDGTITLEVFTADRHFLGYSRDVLRRLWREPESAYDGEFTKFAPINSYPKPASANGPNIHVGGHTEAAAKRAGRIGDGFFPGVVGEGLDLLLDAMRKSAADAGRNAETIEITAFSGLDVDSVKRGAEMGITRAIVPPLGFDLETLRTQLGAFSENVIQKV